MMKWVIVQGVKREILTKAVSEIYERSIRKRCGDAYFWWYHACMNAIRQFGGFPGNFADVVRRIRHFYLMAHPRERDVKPPTFDGHPIDPTLAAQWICFGQFESCEPP